MTPLLRLSRVLALPAVACLSLHLHADMGDTLVVPPTVNRLGAPLPMFDDGGRGLVDVGVPGMPKRGPVATYQMRGGTKRRLVWRDRDRATIPRPRSEKPLPMKRFFNETSFWNQPVGPNPAIDAESDQLVNFMAKADDRGFWLSLHKWTIPVYEVDRNTPRRKVHRRLRADSPWIIQRSAAYLTPDHPLGHGKEFAADAQAGLVPIPDYAIQDPEEDAHIALVDWESGWIWDMWGARRRDDGDWEAKTGMKYRADGSGVFERKDFAVHDGESIHPYGPSRAAGVPELAGLIMHDEILAGRINHKLSFATQAAALQRFVHPPACWTDGGWSKGLPEGAVLQLDPDLDLTPFQLSPAALVVARALQEYGAVCVDVGGGHPLYAEGLYGDPKKRSWDGLLKGDDLIEIKMSHYRVLKMETVIPQGMSRRKPGTIYGGNDPD